MGRYFLNLKPKDFFLQLAKYTEGHTCNEIVDKKDFLGIISGHKMTIYLNEKRFGLLNFSLSGNTPSTA